MYIKWTYKHNFNKNLKKKIKKQMNSQKNWLIVRTKKQQYKEKTTKKNQKIKEID